MGTLANPAEIQLRRLFCPAAARILFLSWAGIIENTSSFDLNCLDKTECIELSQHVR